MTFTVFFCGTGSNSNDFQHPNYISGELVSTLARNHRGLEFDDWLIADGPGSGNYQEDEKWTLPGNYTKGRGTAFGSGWEENVKHAIEVIKKMPSYARAFHTDKEFDVLRRSNIPVQKTHGVTPEGEIFELNPLRKITPQALQKARAQIMNRPLPNQVNLVGWSRGAVTCHMMANAMRDDPALSGIPINIFAVDPVPGALNFQTYRTTVPNNVVDYFAVYARDERSKGFAPTVPKVEARGRCTMMVLPGKHATLAGNAFADGGSSGEQIYSAPGRLVRHLAESFLGDRGTALDHRLGLSGFDQLMLYEDMLNKEEGFGQMKKYTYTMAEGKDDERLVGVGGDWWSIKLSSAEKLKPDHLFVNWHHRALWINTFGSVQNPRKLNVRQKALKLSLPVTSRRVYGS